MEITLPTSFDYQAFAALISCVAAVASVTVAWMVYRSQTSPEIIVYVEPISDGSQIAGLFLKNIGNAPAFNVCLSVQGRIPSADQIDAEELDAFLNRTIPMLPPGSRRGTYIGAFHVLLAPEHIDDALVTVNCVDSGRNKYSWEYPVGVESFRGDILATPIVAQKLSGIESGIVKLTREVRQTRNAIEKAAEKTSNDN